MMSKQGLKSLFPMEDISVMGIWELLPQLYKFRVKLEETAEAALSFNPHVIVTVDAKGFSFRLLKKIRRGSLLARNSQKGFPAPPLHFHYVAPSFWAWKGGESRLRGFSEFVDHVLCILPFEEEVCRLNGLAATFVGHPVLEDALEAANETENGIKMKGNSEEFRNQYGLSTVATIVSLLPGSRLQEVTRMLPIFLNTMELLKESCPSDLLTAAIHVAPNKHVENYIASYSHKLNLPVVLIPGGSSNMRYDAFSASRMALCTSGTVAVELQLARVPCVVAYRAHLLTEYLIRYKAKVQYISLPNILLDEPVLPEVLFHACTPSNLAPIVREVMYNEGVRNVQVVAAERVMRLLLSRPGGNEKLTSLSNDYKPSTIAAFTILYSPRK
ncbi:probable lipid-A-disaccharide synthase, mitochondrial isoform X1 [Impatiens glandulifera]|uniref:probable lipid-A-disaccharide synthase, mitochondrial isoform X1 n=1 Tax=Impatiens glandulifera TaxID=253017 RepID=UPI001FB051FA|nr:probable lipid-A-disaccharide synthase, mitochondrial isoform X1 [Impatiens glandulifera]